MDDTLNYEIHVKRIEFQENQVWRVIDEQSVSIQHEPNEPWLMVETAHSALCYAFAQNQQLCTSMLYTLNDGILDFEILDNPLIADQTYYVFFKQKANQSGKTLGEILEDCYIADVTSPQTERAQQPYFPYKFGEDVLCRSLAEPERKYNRKPNNTRLVFWEDFDQQFKHFYDEPNAKLTVFISSPKLPRAPYVGDRVTKISNEAGIKYFTSKPLDDVVLAYEYKDMVIKWGYSEGAAGVFDIAFVDRLNKLKLLIQFKSPEIARYETAKIVVDTFNHQNEEYDPSARPINQIVNYLLLNNVRYGILTTLRYNYAFERIGKQNGIETIRVSQVKKDVELLKLVFYLLDQSENHTEHEALSEDDILPVKIDQEGNVQCSSGNNIISKFCPRFGRKPRRQEMSPTAAL